MIDIVTYQSQSCQREDLEWLAYIVLPNGEYWGVRFNGATEEIARLKAMARWNKEREKNKHHDLVPALLNKQQENDHWAALIAAPSHHFTGKIWMRNAEGELKRIALTEIEMYEKNGYRRSRPRSK